MRLVSPLAGLAAAFWFTQWYPALVQLRAGPL
jgi:hypothetical protein